MDIVDPRIEEYVGRLLARHDDAVLLEMEAEAERRDFPIVGRTVGVTLELLARAVGARRVFELGSGFGYSAYFFARAVGPGGVVYCTDADPANARAAARYLERAGLWDRVRFSVGEAVTAVGETEGDFDVVFNDIDKEAYPTAWEAVRDRIRPGGLYLCDNVLRHGRVAGAAPDDQPDETEAVASHNRAIALDERYLSVVIPTRDGVMAALRVG